MRERHPKFYDYRATSLEFLGRARECLRAFDEDDIVASLFYAALELRFGIEARLFETLGPVCQMYGIPAENLKEYSATRLLKRLLDLDPDAQDPSATQASVDGGFPPAALEYTPVSCQLAKLHGRLGELLHYRYFKVNPHWQLRASRIEKGSRTLIDVRKFLADVEDELDKATRGGLLVSPKFYERVCAVLAERRSRAQDAEREMGEESRDV